MQAKAAEKEAAKAAKRAAQKEKRAEKAAAKADKAGGDDTSDQENGSQALSQNGSTSGLHKSMSQVSIRSEVNPTPEDDHGRSTTGVLASHPQSRDIQIDSFTLLYHGHELLQDSKLELNYGRRYGLLGLNGCGKSTMLKALAAREVPIPEHIDMYLLDREMPASDKTALKVPLEGGCVTGRSCVFCCTDQSGGGLNVQPPVDAAQLSCSVADVGYAELVIVCGTCRV
mgnify:FL=1